MKIFNSSPMSILLVTAMLTTSSSAAVWVSTTGADFSRTVATNTVSGTLDGVAVTLGSSANSFSTGSTGTNTELTRITENQAGELVNYSFSSPTGIDGLTLLVHNFVNDNTGTASPNSIGNFTVTYADGTVVTDAFGTGGIGQLADIGTSTTFDVTGGIGGQPTGLATAFNNSAILGISSDLNVLDPDGVTDANGNGVVQATYLFSTNIGNPQGSGLISFGSSSAFGGIVGVDFTVIGNSLRGNTAFLGFSGTAVPEPSSAALLGLGALAFLARRKR